MKNVSMPKTKRATLLHIKHGAAPMRRARLTPTTTTPIRGRTATELKLRTCCIRRWQSWVVGGYPGLDPNTNFEETQGSV